MPFSPVCVFDTLTNFFYLLTYNAEINKLCLKSAQMANIALVVRDLTYSYDTIRQKKCEM